MAYKNLQEFIAALEKEGELIRIGAEVSAELEITEITDRVSKKFGPALLFEKVKGSKFPVLINAFGSYKRMGMSLGVQNLDDLAKEISELTKFSNYMSIRKLIKMLPKFWRILMALPVRAIFAPCQQVVEDSDLDTIPILKCWPDDGERFVTLPLVFTKDPESGRQNIGMYRLQVYDKKTTGMHWHLHKDGRSFYEKYKKLGEKMPVSVVIGADPATIYAATAPMPEMLDEILFAGFIRKKPVPMTKCVTNNIRVPANSEFVLEGYVDPQEELRVEGPFGDHTGYYSQKDVYPVFHITKITRKRKPVYPATIVGQPPMEDCYMGKATERIFSPLIKMIAPEIIDYNFPLEGVFHNCVIVQIKKKYPAHAKKIMNTLWGLGQMMYTKMIIVVDENTNPHDIGAVVRNLFTLMDASRDLVINEGPLDALDHASPMRFLGHRLGIDATKKWEVEGYGENFQNNIRSAADENQRTEILDIIKKISIEITDIIDVNIPFGFDDCILISIDKKEGGKAREIIEKLWGNSKISQTKVIVILDKDVNPANLSKVSWKIFNNIDGKRDVFLSPMPDAEKAKIFTKQRIGIDATKKISSEDYVRDWPDDIEMSAEIKELVTRRWSAYGIVLDE